MRISDWSSDVCSSDLGRQAGFGGRAAVVVLCRIAKREYGGRERCLAQLVQEVALVLARVARAQQAPVPVVPVDPGVVAGGDALGAQVARGVEEVLELDLAVAQYVRVGRASGRVLGQEVGEHAVPVLAGEIAEVERDAEPAADGHGVAAVVLGPAVAAAVVGPVLHEPTRDRLAGT